MTLLQTTTTEASVQMKNINYFGLLARGSATPGMLTVVVAPRGKLKSERGIICSFPSLKMQAAAEAAAEAEKAAAEVSDTGSNPCIQVELQYSRRPSYLFYVEY